MAAVPEMAPADLVDLQTGDRMSRAEFHPLYEQTPPEFGAELIGGIVYVASPLKRRHGTNHLPLGSLFFLYEGQTPGVESADNTTVLLGEESEPQPDLFLRILPECRGQTTTTAHDYVAGAPELMAEIAHSNRAIALHAKRDDFARYGVLEYLVLSLRENRLRWFDLSAGREVQPDADGVYRIRCFPGLWIDGAALLARDSRRLLEVLNQGLATPEHAAFVRRLAAARTGGKKTASRRRPR